MILLSARKLNSRFNMMTVNLNGPKVFPSFCVIFWFFRSNLFPIAMRFSAEALSLRWMLLSEWVLGIRCLFLIILLNHLLQEIQNLHLFGLSGLLSHSVFSDFLLMHPTFQFFYLSNQNIFFPNFHREQSMSWKDSPNLRSFWDFPSLADE